MACEKDIAKELALSLEADNSHRGPRVTVFLDKKVTYLNGDCGGVWDGSAGLFSRAFWSASPAQASAYSCRALFRVALCRTARAGGGGSAH